MTIAVLNATGAQARAVADHLAADYDVRRLSRTGAPGLFAVDTGSEDDLTRALTGVTAAVFTSPLDYQPGVRQAYACRVARAAERAGVGRLVVNLAAAVPDTDQPFAANLREIRSIFQVGSVPVTVVQPTVYLDNLVAPWALPAIVNDGILASPAPVDARISHISHASLAAFIAAVLGRPETIGKVYDIGGPQALTGPELAAIVAHAAGRPVQCLAVNFADFASGINAAFGAPTGDDVADSYRHLVDHPEALSRDQAAWQAVGVVPETAAEWAARQGWAI